MEYRVVMGFYPSYNTAKKMLDKAKSFCKEAKIIKDQECFVVVLKETDDYEVADTFFSQCMKRKLYCGVQKTR